MLCYNLAVTYRQLELGLSGAPCIIHTSIYPAIFTSSWYALCLPSHMAYPSGPDLVWCHPYNQESSIVICIHNTQ